MRIIGKLKAKLGFGQSYIEDPVPKDLETEKTFLNIYEKCRPFTMTSPERMFSLHKAVEYVASHGIEGDFVECGVWKGGSAMMMASSLLLNNDQRNIYLYDTFEGMSEPNEKDKDLYGNSADELLKESDKYSDRSIWCYSTLEQVQQNIYSTNYPKGKIHFIRGKVEDTIPNTIPKKIALLRLDTDWFDSTYHELVHLYPLLSNKGILIIDDYGHWEGARKAVDQYFKEMNIVPLMHRIDYTGRILQKLD